MQVASSVYDCCAGPDVYFHLVVADVRGIQASISTHVSAIAQALADTVTADLLSRCSRVTERFAAAHARVSAAPQSVAEVVAFSAFLEETEADAAVAQRRADVDEICALFAQIERSNVAVPHACVSAFWAARLAVPQLKVRHA